MMRMMHECHLKQTSDVSPSQHVISSQQSCSGSGLIQHHSALVFFFPPYKPS